MKCSWQTFLSPLKGTVSVSCPFRAFLNNPFNGNVIKLTENEKEAGVCLYVSEQTPAITYTKMA